jgi:hypothetical protein
MAQLSNQRALAIAKQSSPNTWASPTTADLIPAAGLSWTANAITADNPEYTGSINRVGPGVFGATYEVTATFLIRGPGGSNPPAANAFILGRVLQSLGFTEQVLSAAIPVSAEALTAGSTTGFTMGAGATGTLDLYKGLAVKVPFLGSSPDDLAMIRSYAANKATVLGETAGGTITGNYQIPKQLAYTLAGTGTPPSLSGSLWEGAKRYDFIDMVPSSGKLTFPTASRENVDFAKLEITFSCDLYASADDTCPAIPSLGAVPAFRDGKLFVAQKAMGGSSISIDLGLKVSYPPNPNKTSGSDAPQLTETRRTISLDLNTEAKSYMDFLAIASGQGYYPISGLFGFYPGNFVGFIATDARFNFPKSNEGGDFITSSGEAWIDGPDKTLSISFVY